MPGMVVVPENGKGGTSQAHEDERERPGDSAAFALAAAGVVDDSRNGVVERWERDRLSRRRHGHDATMTSTMFPVKVSRADASLLHDQVAAQIRRAIADGEAQPGERLPPARDLAAVMGVNANTVLRALRLLRDEGLLEFRRGHGVQVSGTPERGAVLARVHELVEFAGQHGYRRAELLEMIQRAP